MHSAAEGTGGDFVLLRSGEREECGQANERARCDRESVTRYARAEPDENADRECAEAHRSGLVEAAGYTFRAFLAQSAHHAAAAGDDELAEAGAHQHENERWR